LKPGFFKKRGPGKPGHFAKPETGFGQSAEPTGFGFAFLHQTLHLMEYYTILNNRKRVFD